MGDPAGVGPELCLRVLADAAVAGICTPIVFGDREILSRAARACGLSAPANVIAQDQWVEVRSRISDPSVLHIESLKDADKVDPGNVSPETGRAAYAFIESALDAALAGEVDAVCTGPIHKEVLNAAGVEFPGHTEIFALRTGAKRSCMMLTSESITCSLVTCHTGLRDVPGQLSVQRVLDTIELSHKAMIQLRGRPPRIVVCGLNPHAGEHGLFGDREEERFIVPAIASARSQGIDVEGPLPPDTAFVPARRNEADCYVCMYHDQGLIPLKALAFDTAVNVTLGLPIVRTSVDHGTALDIAWQGKADVTSMMHAVRLAARLATSRAESVSN